MSNASSDKAKQLLLGIFLLLLLLPFVQAFFNPNTNWLSAGVHAAINVFLMVFTYLGKKWAHRILVMLTGLAGVIGIAAGSVTYNELGISLLVLGGGYLGAAIFLSLNSTIKAHVQPKPKN